jgi:hypothetical protein
MKPFAYTCPFCGRAATITEEDFYREDFEFFNENKHGPMRVDFIFIVCPNLLCREFSFLLNMHKMEQVITDPQTYWESRDAFNNWKLIPKSRARVFPDYIPEPLRDDYTEACLIENLSPKASATLSRRCLQGMIRDFWGVREKTLFDEIDAIKDKVDSLTWQAIDSVRKVGNIGAHMEKDINVIIDVEPGEASLLINLIEKLFKDWYITRHEREQEMQAIVDMASKKDAQKKQQNDT